MRIIMVQNRFIEAVESGAKMHTIRGPRKIPATVGEQFSVRHWTGRPYLSPTVEIKVVRLTRVAPIAITSADEILLCGNTLSHTDSNRLAINDGFRDLPEMLEWFRATHRLPFDGFVLSWRPPKENDKRDAPTTNAQVAMAKRHGTPYDFAFAAWKAVGEISSAEIATAVTRYNQEWDDAALP